MNFKIATLITVAVLSIASASYATMRCFTVCTDNGCYQACQRIK